MSGWAFYALGEPAPQGSKRHVGGGRMVESSKAVKPWREAVTHAAFGAGPKLEGPVAVRMTFTLARPKTAPKKLHTPFKKPDLDKLARSTFDAITAAGLWNDDAQVACLTTLKLWPRPCSWASGGLPVPGVVVAAVEITPSSLLLVDPVMETAAAARKAWATYEQAEEATAS